MYVAICSLVPGIVSWQLQLEKLRFSSFSDQKPLNSDGKILSLSRLQVNYKLRL